MKISCQESRVEGASFAEKVANLEKYGYDGIELDGGELHEPGKLDERRRVLKTSKLRASSICGGFACEMVHPEPARRRACIDTIKRFLDFSAEVGALGPISVPIFNNNQRVPDLSPWKSQHQLELEFLTELVRDIAKYAEERKVALLLEPLNRYESSSLKDVSEAASVCRNVGGTGVRVMADFFHMHIEERNTPKSLAEIADVLGHVHLADNTRMEPGTGDIDFRAGFAALKKSGFKGYMALECKLSEAPSIALPRCAKFLRSCIAEA